MSRILTVVVAAGLGALFAHRALAQSPQPDDPFAPTVENKTRSPASAPPGMVWIPGGEFSMGSRDVGKCACDGPPEMPDARPVHRVYVDGFWMDTTDITNEQFAKFVAASGDITIAERKPRK